MKWFIQAVKNTFNYQGRARRAEFGWFYLINFSLQISAFILFWVVIFSIAQKSGQFNNANPSLPQGLDTFIIISYITFCVFQFMMWITSLSLVTRRLHDLGWSGWWQLAFYITPLLFFLPLNLALANEVNPQPQKTILLATVGLSILYCLSVLVVTCFLFFKDGQRKTNKYGTDPKAKEYADYAEMLQQEKNSATTNISTLTNN